MRDNKPVQRLNPWIVFFAAAVPAAVVLLVLSACGPTPYPNDGRFFDRHRCHNYDAKGCPSPSGWRGRR